MQANIKIEVDTVYLCRTIEDAEGFLAECDKQGICWCDGIKASEAVNYDYGEDTCYRVNSNLDGKPYLTYDSRDYYEDECDEEIVVYIFMTDEDRAAIDTAWKEMMQIEEQPK